ncbi:forkhead-associated domain-containing protein 1-like [Physella acuta]|uniref:forkhead-associated domain-containing protein 1-like n=1 Tax=Physella acuta TaxID=109671 RepID=UPI0027DC5D40|nr:forkhead-associated domain-containing protein 1-like [Physella acuta]
MQDKYTVFISNASNNISGLNQISMGKSYLKGADGTLFPLLPKVTTVGRENCDFTIQLPGVDYQHCVIEYSEQDDCFIIQDLNTAQGTYVNDVRIQNAAVRLAPGDYVRFGYNGQPFELQVENQPQLRGRNLMSIPPVTQRPPIWNQPITMITDQDIYNTYGVSQYGGSQGLPHISYATTSVQPNALWSQANYSQPPPPVPRPPLRSRPLSAGAARRNVQNLQAVGPAVQRTTVVGGWVNQPLMRTSSIPDLQEKEQRLNQLSDEVNRLRTFEFESVRKDSLIQQLQQQITELQTKMRQEPAIIMGGDTDMSGKLLHLETEVSAKKGEINALKEQLNKLQEDRSTSPHLLRQELGERVKEISLLRNELERVKKDKNITSGLVTQMQRDMSSKDSTISRMAREIEVLKKDIREREIQMTAVNSAKDVPPYLRLDGGKTKDQPKEEISAREKELISLRQKFKTAESKVQEQTDLVAALREELDKSKASFLSEKEAQKKILADLEAAKVQVHDIQRSERVVRVDLEQSQKRFERLRNRVFQVIYSTPGVQAPEKEINDDELIEALKKLVEERAKQFSKIKELEADVVGAKSGKDELLAQATKLKEILESSVHRLKENGYLSSSLKQELSIIQTASTEDSLTWIRDLLFESISSELEWVIRTEQALIKCGVNVNISHDEPSKHIESLFAKWESSLMEVESLKQQIVEQDKTHKAELEDKAKAVQSEMESLLQDAVEKARLEGDAKLNIAIDEIRMAETEKRDSCVEVERRKIHELESALEQLRGSLSERQADDQAKLMEACAALQEIEVLRNTEKSLREEILKLEQLRIEDSEKLSSERKSLEEKFESDLSTYKEQIKQHSVTICTMEERVEKLMKKNKDYQEQINKVKSEKSKPVLAPKPKVIIERPREELAALEHLVNALRQENLVLKKEIRDSQDVIKGLRRDLSGASARLSDISGEMSESQKQEMERNRELLQQRSTESTELRQQLAKLSKIIDSQKEELRKLESELSKEQSLSSKYKMGLEERSTQLKVLEGELNREKEEQKKQLELIDQEGRITTELTSLGAQCRGERHEQIINRQREALAELRSKVKVLEQNRPLLPTQDQALHQVLMLKKELAEMRVNQAMAEDKIIKGATSLDREIGKARGLITPANFEADMERSAHRETMDALDCSEASFMSLLRSMACTLDIEQIEGLRPMAHAPRDEREALLAARERACQLLTSRIQVLKERIARKDELLQGYETDLTKLRQSQDFAARKSQEVEALANDVRTKSEESEYLRESLSRTRDKLNQEKRLNSAIKEKKTFHLENERAHLQNNGRVHHHCAVEDPKNVAKIRKQNDTIKRKNYMIKTLKEDLCETEKELYERDKRLISFETSRMLDQPM